MYKKSVSKDIHVISLRQEHTRRQNSQNRADSIAFKLEDGFFKKLVDSMQIGVIVSDRNTILSGDLPFYLTQDRRITSGRNPNSLKEVHDRAEKEAILFALEQTHNNKSEAAKMLNINRTLLYKEMARHKIALTPE